MLEAPTLVVRHAASRERLGETLLEDSRGHGLREGGDSRDCVLPQGSRQFVAWCMATTSLFSGGRKTFMT